MADDGAGGPQGTPAEEAPDDRAADHRAGVDRPRLVFVGGSPRSGTTLVQHVLDSHPRVVGGPEFDFLPDIARLWARMADSSVRGRTRFFYDEATLDAAFTTLLRTLLVGDRAGPDVDVISEKTPSNLLVFEELARRLPAARFVLVVRDPRAVASSLVEVGRRAAAAGRNPPRLAGSFPDVLATIARHADAGAAAIDRLGPRLHTVHYEELLEDTERTVRELCDALGLPFDPAMTDPAAAEHPRAESGLEGWRVPETDGRPIDATRAERWREVLDPAQVRLVEARFAGHPLFARYLGGAAPPSPVTRARLRALESPTAARLRRLVSILPSRLRCRRRPAEGPIGP